jgi:hypothetical protein
MRDRSIHIDARTSVPEPARLAAGHLQRWDYVDSYSLPLPASAPTLDALVIQTLTDLPGWVVRTLRLRDQLVGVFGLQTGGADEQLGHSDLPLRPGGRVAFFPVVARDTGDEHDEVLLAEDDKHLAFCVSGICARDAKGDRRFALTTVVVFHNGFGRLYFLPVKPFHRLIMRALMRRLAAKLETGRLHPPPVSLK